MSLDKNELYQKALPASHSPEGMSEQTESIKLHSCSMTFLRMALVGDRKQAHCFR